MIKFATLFLMVSVAFAQTADIDFNCNTFIATNAQLDPAVSNSQAGGSAVYLHDGSLPGNVREFQFLASGRFEINDTTASLTGQLVPTGATSLEHGYYFVLSLQLAADASGRNMLQAGVSVDQSSWMYFSISTPSYIVGYGDYASSPINIAQLLQSLPFQVGLGANGKNLNFGASVAIDINAGPYHIAGDVNIDLSCDLEAHQSSSSNELPSSSSSATSSSESNELPSSSSSVASSSSESASSNNAASSSESSNDCPAAPFFSVNTDNIYVCYTANQDQLDANIEFSDGFTFNWHPLPVFATRDNCYTIQLPAGHGSIVWVQVNGFNCHYGEDNSNREQNCGSQLCLPSSAGSSSSSSAPSSSDSSSSNNAASSSSQSASSVESSSNEVSGSGCSIDVKINKANTWIENGRETSLVYVTFTNDGSRAIKDVSMKMDNHGDNCSAFSQSCIRQYWSIFATACTSQDDISCVYGLPDWLTLYGGLAAGAQHNWGFITYSAQVDLQVTPTCL